MCRPVGAYTGSDHPLDADPGRVDLLGELVDGLRGVFICIRVHIGLYTWERDYGDRKKDTKPLNILIGQEGNII